MHIRFAGIEIGCKRDDSLYIADYDPPTMEFDTDRTARLGRSGVAAGRDFARSAVWNFGLSIREGSTAEVLASAEHLERAWREDLSGPGELVALEYSTDHGGTWYRVYGRPGRFTGPRADWQAALGRGQIDLQFEQLDPLHYRSSESTTRVNVVAGMLGFGVRAPVRAPVRTTMRNFEPRAGAVVNAGDRPAVVRVRFQGPCTNPRVWADGFEAGYRGGLAYDQSVTLDGREMTAILRGGGRSPRHVAGAVTRKTRLSKLTVPPGASNLWFEADDPTGTSFVDVFWRDAFTSMQ